jgi:hypothetical protein
MYDHTVRCGDVKFTRALRRAEDARFSESVEHSHFKTSSRLARLPDLSSVTEVHSDRIFGERPLNWLAKTSAGD